jgi:hypothetical protein
MLLDPSLEMLFGACRSLGDLCHCALDQVTHHGWSDAAAEHDWSFTRIGAHVIALDVCPEAPRELASEVGRALTC